MTAPPVEIYDWRQEGDGSFTQLPQNPTLQQVQDLFQFEIDHSYGYDRAAPGELYWKLHALYLRTGYSGCIVKVINEFDQPYPNILCFRTWPDAPEFLPEVSTHPLDHIRHGVADFTNGDGDWGVPYGTGDYIGDNGGVSSFWVAANPPDKRPPEWSDAVHKHGMLGGTDHLAPHPVFKLERKEGIVIPPPGDGQYKLANVINGEVVGWLTFGNNGAMENRLVLYDNEVPVGHLNWE